MSGTFHHRCAVLIAMLVAAQLIVRPLAAEVFHLAGGGTVEGVLLNPDESPRSTYEVRTEGGTVVLGRTVVREVVAFSEQLKKYEEFLVRMPDTIDGHLQMATWCEDNNLPSKRDFHLNEIIRREPDHAEARKGLGYQKFRDGWIIHDEWMKRQGYVRAGGGWRFPQELAIEEHTQKIEDQQDDWKRQVRVWRSWLKRGGDRANEAAQEFSKLQDPYASAAIIELLKDEGVGPIRELLVSTLGNIPTSDATFTLAEIAANDPDPSVRDRATTALENRNHDLAVSYLIRQLTSEDNAVVNRAAMVLGRLKHPASIRPLMDALVTTHKFVVKPGGTPGQMNAAFSGDGGLPGMSFGTPKAKVIQRDLPNSEVLAALLLVTEQEVNFQYDEARWKAWFANEKIPLSIDLRRDG